MKKKMSFQKLVSRLIGMLLLGFWVYQVAGGVHYLGERLKNKVVPNRELDAVERSADVSYGSEFTNIITFLRNSIPSQATVLILSTQDSANPMNDTYLMQYLLFPRNIVFCPSDCTALINDPVLFIIAQNEFPSMETSSTRKQFVRYDDTLGLFIPVNAENVP
jgi:hypothetical protein